MEDNNAQNNSNYVEIEAMISLIFHLTGRDYSANKALVSQWVIDGEKLIDTFKGCEPVLNYEIDIQRYRGKLPPGTFKVTNANYCILSRPCSCGQSPCVCNGCSCGAFTSQNHTVLSSRGAIRNSCSCGAYYYKKSAVSWRQQGCFLMVPYPTGFATIDFLKMPVDSNELPMILDTHLNALVNYGIYQFTYGQYILGRINRGVYKDVEERWFTLCGQTRGNDMMPDENRSSFAAQVNNDPYKMKTQY